MLTDVHFVKSNFMAMVVTVITCGKSFLTACPNTKATTRGPQQICAVNGTGEKNRHKVMTTATLIDTSDGHYATVISQSLEAYEKFLATGARDDLKTWIELDREKRRILDARQRKMAQQKARMQ
jgi:crotonobetainyl-CoA:carnitine CoA-transferase CaiB-like acyl-CoA transferase